MCKKCVWKSTQRNAATPSSIFPIIFDLLSGPFQLMRCWHAPRSMHGDICTSGISHPVFLNPSLPPVWTQPPISGKHLANFICFYMLNNHFVVQNVSKKEQSEGCGGEVWMCYSWLSRVTFHGCPLFIQAVCTEKAGVSAHAALPLQECRAKERRREKYGTHAQHLNHCRFWKRTKGQRWTGASGIPTPPSPFEVLNLLI